MYLQTDKAFKNSRLNIFKNELDYSSLETEELLIFIYGYPIDFEKRQWVDCEALAGYFRSGSWTFLEKIDGLFTMLILDKANARLFVITDRLGIYTLFYHSTGDRLYIGDRVPEIRDEIPDPGLNIKSVLELINLGFKIGNKTLYNNILEFEPARIYEFNSDLSFSEKEYWSVFDLKPSDKISTEEFRQLYNKNLDIVTDLENRILLPISGGKDTRMLLSAIMNKKEKLHCYTFGPSYHSDIRGSVKICDKLDISHSIIDSDHAFGRRIDFNRDLRDMNVNGIGPYFFNLLVREALIHEQGKAELDLQGELGNQTWRHHPFGRAVPESMDVGENARWMLQHITRVLYFKGDHKGRYDGLYRNMAVGEVEEQLLESIGNDLKKLSDPQIPSDFSEFFILRSLAYNFYSNILKFIGRHYKLFVSSLQKDLLQQLHLMSIEERVRGPQIDYIIAKNNTFLSTMPYYNSGRVVKYIKMITNTFFEKSLGFFVFNHPELHNYPVWIRKYHKDFFYRILDPQHMVLGDLFNSEKLKSQVSLFLENKYSVFGKKKVLYKYSNQHFVYHLFSLEQWLQSKS